MGKVAVIIGSINDKAIAREALDTLRQFDIPAIVRVLSAHRTPAETQKFAGSLEQDGYGVVIAIAGMAAHLAGVIASHTVLPVIGVPVAAGNLGGMDALLSTVQMPSGIPVASVAVNGGRNAALLAAGILALADPALHEKLIAERAKLRDKVLEVDRALQKELNGRQGRV